MPITILDVAKAEGVKESEDGSISMGEIERLNLPFFGGCQDCGASLACYNMYPTVTGYVKCRDCVTDLSGYTTVKDFQDDNPNE